MMAAVAADVGPVAADSGGLTAVLLGQYLGPGLLSADEERRLYPQMAEETVAAGLSRPGVQGPSGDGGEPDHSAGAPGQQLHPGHGGRGHRPTAVRAGTTGVTAAVPLASWCARSAI